MYDKLIPTTEIEAVNALLEQIGEPPVNSLDDLALDSGSAQNTLNRVSREVQVRGWHWNTSFVKMLKNSQDEYDLPVNVIRADTVGNSSLVNVIIRNGKLYDRRPFKNTYKFEEAELVVKLISLLPYGELTEAARQYIYIRAARQFQEFSLGAQSISQFSSDDEAYALANIMDEEMDNGDYNMLQHPDLQQSLARFPVGRRF